MDSNRHKPYSVRRFNACRDIGAELLKLESENLSPLKLSSGYSDNDSESNSEDDSSDNATESSSENDDLSQDEDFIDNINEFCPQDGDGYPGNKASGESDNRVSGPKDSETYSSVDIPWEDIPGPSWRNLPGEISSRMDYTLSEIMPEQQNYTELTPVKRLQCSSDYSSLNFAFSPPGSSSKYRSPEPSLAESPEPPVVQNLKNAKLAARGRKNMPSKGNIGPSSTRKRGRNVDSVLNLKKNQRGKQLPKDKRARLNDYWQWLDKKPHDMFMQQFEFTGPTPGPTLNYTTPICPLEVFESFQTDLILNYIMTETNNKGKSKREWNDITITDLRLMDAILITMGIVHMPQQRHYWSYEPMFDYSFVRRIMPRDQFLSIFRNLYFSSDPSNKDVDKLYLVRDLINMYKEVFRKNYNPSENLSVDESLALWKSNRIGFNVKQPRKTAKSGMQQYRLCESSTGYCCDLEYHSANPIEAYDNVEIEDFDVSDFTKPAKIVLHLLKPYLNCGHTVGIDSYYTDPRLVEVLINNKTDCIGTFASNRRFFPEGVRPRRLPVGHLESWYKKLQINENSPGNVGQNVENEDIKHLMCLIWQDKKTVRLLSTYHDDELFEIPDKRKRANNENSKKYKPRAAIEYKYIMPGVDKMDQMMSTYDPARKRLKRYYRRLYFTMLEMSFYNSYVVYSILIHPETTSYLQYKMMVVKMTIEKYGKNYYKNHDGSVTTVEKMMSELQSRPQVHESYRLHPGDHHPVPIVLDVMGKEGYKGYRKCKFCNSQTVKPENLQNKATHQRTKYKCIICNVPLCVYPCHLLYHTVEDYKNHQRNKNVSHLILFL